MRGGIAGILLLETATSCGLLCHDVDCPQARPVQGEPQDFTAGPRSEDQIDVSSAVPCQAPSEDGYGVEVTRTGGALLSFVPDPDEVDAQVWLEALANSLRDDGTAPHDWGFGASCRSEQTVLYLAIDDWADTNDVVGEVVAALDRDDLEGTIEIRIERERIACPDTDCSW
jgi:hypothetical protein